MINLVIVLTVLTVIKNRTESQQGLSLSKLLIKQRETLHQLQFNYFKFICRCIKLLLFIAGMVMKFTVQLHG